MKIIIILLMLLTVANSHAEDAKGNFAIWGVGNKSCFSYDSARENNNYDDYKNFLMGFLTAYNALAPDTFRISGNMDIDAIIDWIDAHCETNKLHAFQQGISTYIIAHTDKRLKKSPQRSQLR